MKENDENWLETIYRDNDNFDTYMLVSEAKALLKYFKENGYQNLPEALHGLYERVCMELSKYYIDNNISESDRSEWVQ